MCFERYLDNISSVGDQGFGEPWQPYCRGKHGSADRRATCSPQPSRWNVPVVCVSCARTAHSAEIRSVPRAFCKRYITVDFYCRVRSFNNPYLQEAACRLGAADDVAAKIGAVNTLVRQEDGSLNGHNTDWDAAISAVADALWAGAPLICAKNLAFLDARPPTICFVIPALRPSVGYIKSVSIL